MAGGIIRNRIFHLLLISVAAVAIYSNTLGVPFHFDDMTSIYGNPLIKELAYFANPSDTRNLGVPADVMLMWKTRPLGYFTFALNYKLGGLAPAGYHLTNIMVHAICSVLVYLLVLLIFRTPRLVDSPLANRSWQVALITGLIFAVHPVQTQAVTYIVQRFASMSTLFFVASLAFYARFRLVSGVRTVVYYVAGLVAALFAMTTKETAFTLPLIIVVFELIFFSGSMKKRLLYALPFFIIAMIIPLSVMSADGPVSDILSGVGKDLASNNVPSRAHYMLTESRVLVTYLRLLFFPFNLNLDYDYTVFSSIFNVQVMLSVFLLLCMFLTGVLLLIRSRQTLPELSIISFGIFWFFITLSVESSVIPIADVIYEHRLYLSGIGAIAATVMAFFLVSVRMGGRRLSTAISVSLILVCMVLAVGTYERNRTWQSKVSLWEDVVGKSPLKARPRNNLGESYNDEGRFGEAREQFRAALKIDPLFVEAHLNLGLAYMGSGELAKADQEFRYVLMINPRSFEAAKYLQYIQKQR